MQVLEAIRARRSHRKYQDAPISEEVLERLLDAMRLAPSGSNRQPWRFVIVRDKDLRQRLVAACYNQKFIAEAPLVVVACAVPGTSVRGACVNLSIALDHLSLAAVDEGLGTCWIGAFTESEVRSILGIPEDVSVVMLMTVGYPTESPAPRPRKQPTEIYCYDKWA